MKLLARRALTAVGTGVALLGAAAAMHGAKPSAPAHAGKGPSLTALLRAEESARGQLTAAVQDVSRRDRQARSDIVQVESSIQATRERLAAAAAAATARLQAPSVQTVTGASGGGDDSAGSDGGGGDD